MAHWGATYIEVVQSLQGADTSNTLTPNDYGTQEEIETIMTRVERLIIAKLPQPAQDVLLRGKVKCHKVIEDSQNTAQTAVDYGQDFIGTVDVLTFKIGQNQELANTEDGLAGTEWDITANVLTVSATISRGDTFYSYYSLDPETIVLPQLAQLLIDECTIILGRREVFGGSGDDGGISDSAETLSIEIQEMLNSFQTTTAVSGLLEMNLCEPITGPNVAKVVSFCRSR